METDFESDEPRVASYLADDEADVALNELRSPPRIRRLQDRLRKSYGASQSDSYISSSDDESSVDSSSMDLAYQQTLQQTPSPKLRFPSWEIQQLPSTPTSHQQSPPHLSLSAPGTNNNNSGITEYRRRLEIIKERRGRQISRSSEHTSRLSLFPQELEIESNLINRPILYGHQRRPSATVDEVFELLHEASESTCQTFDEITIDTTRTMDSTTNICQSSSSEHPLPISTPSISSGQERKGKVSRNKNSLNIRRLMCTSSQKKIDTSFEQIIGTTCNTTATLTSSTANDDIDRHYSETTKANSTSDDIEHTVVDGEFSGILASSTIASMNAPDNQSLDRTLCTEPISPNGKQTESSLPKTKSCSSFFSFQVGIKHDNKDKDNDNDNTSNLHNETPNSSSSPSRSRGLFRPRARGRAYNIVMDSDDQDSQQHQQIATEGSKISSIPRRNSSSSFSWFRKDPWYVRPANAREGGGGDDEIMADEYGNTNNEGLDRMMHAVVYVTQKQIGLQ